jgi:antitoxin CptB
MWFYLAIVLPFTDIPVKAREKHVTITGTSFSRDRKKNMDINNKARIHWACRRGMRELDISIMPFFEHEYDNLSDDEKRIFIRLLECDDPDLFNWLMNHGKPADAQLEQMVRLIQTRNRERGPVAI